MFHKGLVVIDAAVTDGAFATNPVLAKAIEHVRAMGGTLHFFGLCSDGRVHSSLDHLEALIDATTLAGVPFVIDAFLDGRDTPPRSALDYIARIETYLAKHNAPGAIASVTGRFFAMDRDKRWDRVEKAYDLLANSEAAYREPTARAAVEAAYARGENDEFVLPTIVGTPQPVRDGDAVIFFNFRPDRARELTLAFCSEHFTHFPVSAKVNLYFATMTRYEDEFPNPVLFGPRRRRARSARSSRSTDSHNFGSPKPRSTPT